MIKQKPTSVIISAILCITLLEGAALYKGIDGILFSLSVAAVAGLAGWVLKSPIQQ